MRFRGCGFHDGGAFRFPAGAFFTEKIWPHMFYMSDSDLWRWKANAARAMGNTLDEAYIPGLVRAFSESGDERVAAMIAWALGRIGGDSARQALEAFLPGSRSPVREEIQASLATSFRCGSSERRGPASGGPHRR